MTQYATGILMYVCCE